MSGPEDRLSPATRNIVVFGGLLVLGLVLAVREQFGSHSGRGETDSPMRLMIVGGSPEAALELDEVDGFAVLRASFGEVVTGGRELLDDDTPAYAAAIAHADQLGYGFVALSLIDADGTPHDWEFDAEDVGISSLPDATAQFAVFSVGELAPEGPRMHSATIAPVEYEAPLGETEHLRLSLFGHPDLQSLWQRELPIVQLQGRQVLERRGLHERYETTLRNQARWQELSELWPAPGVIPGMLADRWEQVRAAPIRGGVLLEVRQASVQISQHRRASLSLGDASLWFLPIAALREAPGSGRTRCEGLPETITGDITIAPDGAALILRERPGASAQVFVFDDDAARDGTCVATLTATPTLGRYDLGRPNAAGVVAWTAVDELRWFDATGDYRGHALGVHAYSGPWWVEGGLLAMIAERPLPIEVFPDMADEDLDARELAPLGVEPVLSLFDTATAPRVALVDTEQGDVRLQVELDAAALFGPDTDPNTAPLIDLRPSGRDALLLLTDRCADDLDNPRPCLHRLRSSGPLHALLPARAVAMHESAAMHEPSVAEPTAPPAFTVETLGPLGPYLSLAIAAEGGRAVWTAAIDDAEPQLWCADLRGPERMQPRRVDDDALGDANPRVSADGRVVISEVSLALDELGSISVARAFVLPAVADE